MAVTCHNPNGAAGGSWQYTATWAESEGGEYSTEGCTAPSGSPLVATCSKLQPNKLYWFKCEATDATGTKSAIGTART